MATELAGEPQLESAPAPEPDAARRLDWTRQESSFGAREDLLYGLTMLDAAKKGRLGPALRLYRPVPTVAFGQRDAHLPGFEEAAARCRALGFEPLVRKAGGRAAAYHQGCLVLDHVEPERDAIIGAKSRFSQFGELLAKGLRDARLIAQVGEIPGEYCPGEFSIHGEHPEDATVQVKLVGTAQRVVSGAWLFSSVVVVENSVPLREVLTQSYDALGLDWDPRTAGAAEDLVPGTDVDKVEQALLGAFGSYATTREIPFADLASVAGVPGSAP